MARIRPTPHLRAVSQLRQPRHRGSIAASTLFIMGATFASTLLGFMREVVSARYYGTRWEMDTFLAAATIPTILFGVFNGALVSALVPTFSEYLAHRKEEEAWRLANTTLNMLAIVLTSCAIVGFFTARWYVPLIAHGFPAPQMGVAIRMTRWLMPSIVAVSLSGVISAMLYAYHRFRAAALIGVAVNAVTIACIVLLNHSMDIYALVVGTALGLTAQLLVQLPSFLSIGRYRPIIDLHHPGLKKIWVLLGPIIVGSAAGQLALFFDRFFASTLAPGYISGMNYATKLVNFPQQIFAAAIATVIFPLLAAQFARENRRGVARSVVTGLRLVNFITIPAVCALIVLAHPMVQALFERGSFQATATDLTAGLLPYAAIGLIALAANVVLTRCCFACRETLWPVTISVVTVIVNVLLSLVWLPSLGARGLLLANSLSQSMQAVLLLFVTTRLVAGIDWGALMLSTGKVVVSSLAMLAALGWIGALGVTPEATLASRGWFLFGQIAIGGTVFVAVARMLGVEELNLAWHTIVAKFERNLVSPPENREAPIA
ncbi:MAG TPA: murein biosynthesis integral membrane protein MurJ [Candidatus Acidoferrales bacterium]|jgi:putative peptidoglycan lipid II flippase|nr:murein biosynthesis integral membrane protein MurJ [Candidatus Acidoferrales bacterium]